MLMKKNLFLTSFILLTCVSGLWAGDLASFVDLGFSPDGRTYMFGQYGVQLQSLKPWAELYVVDVNSNNFVQNGKVSYVHNTPIRAGQDGSGVFYRLISGNSNLANNYGITFQNQGLPLYISRNENPSAYGERIDFRDFISGNSYTAELVPSITGSGQNTRSSFYIRLERRSPSGQSRSYTVGSPGVIRPLIVSYNIKRVLIDPQGSSIIFVIEMKRLAEDGYDIRYMIEAQRL
jgi:predicted secreted protein